jgi:hypothetical protein
MEIVGLISGGKGKIKNIKTKDSCYNVFFKKNNKKVNKMSTIRT